MKLILLLIMLPFILPIIIAIFFILRLVIKGKNEGFKGIIIDKSHNTKRKDGYKNRMEHFYSFTIKTEDGKQRNIAVSSDLYSSCEIGDSIEKPKGAFFPKKVS